MPLAWTGARDALAAALAGAPQGDRAAVRSALDVLNTLGAKYDAAVSAGELAPRSGSTLDVITAGQRAAALAALQRAITKGEALPGVGSFTPFAPGDPFGVPGGATTSDATARVPGVTAAAVIPGAAGNLLSLELGRDAEGLRVTVRYGGRAAITGARVAGDGNGVLRAPEVEKLVRVRASDIRSFPAAPAAPFVLALAGGAGAAAQGAAYRAELALAAVEHRAAAQGVGPAEAVALTLAAERIRALRGEVLSAAPTDAASTLERELVAAMERSAALVAYLA